MVLVVELLHVRLEALRVVIGVPVDCHQVNRAGPTVLEELVHPPRPHVGRRTVCHRGRRNAHLGREWLQAHQVAGGRVGGANVRLGAEVRLVEAQDGFDAGCVNGGGPLGVQRGGQAPEHGIEVQGGAEPVALVAQAVTPGDVAISAEEICEGAVVIRETALSLGEGEGRS